MQLPLLICCSLWLSVSAADSCSHLPGYSKYGASCYKLFTTETQWAAAEASCVAEGGHLASIHSREEQAFIESLVSETTWIGLSGTKITTAWSDNTPLDYENWYGGNPDSDSEACGRLLAQRSFKWGDFDCTKSFQYVCRSVTTNSGTTTLATTTSATTTFSHQARFTKVPGGVPQDTAAPASSVRQVRSRIECPNRCQQDAQCVHFMMSEEGGTYLCETYSSLYRPLTPTPPTDNYRKI